MSNPSYTDDGDPAPRRPAGSSPVMKVVAVGAAVAVLALGASAAISKTAGSSPSASGSQGAQPAGMPAAGRPMGAAVTGITLSKLESVVTAKYPGTIERAMQLPNGSYEVHVIQSGGQEVHVLVSKELKITGTRQGGSPAGAPPAGQATPSPSGSGTKS
jgi:hypothetical protein